jgi:hypothetical protein
MGLIENTELLNQSVDFAVNSGTLLARLKKAKYGNCLIKPVKLLSDMNNMVTPVGMVETIYNTAMYGGEKLESIWNSTFKIKTQ